MTVKMEPEAGGCEATSRGDGTYTIQKVCLCVLFSLIDKKD